MSVNDSIGGLATDTLTVTRMAAKVPNNIGVYVDGSTTTFDITAVVQPAFNLNRIIGGSNLASELGLQQAESIYQIHTTTELKSRTSTTEPDTVTYAGDAYTVARVEKWNLDGEIHYHAVITKKTKGAS